jgi:RHS repeat-associated protein
MKNAAKVSHVLLALAVAMLSQGIAIADVITYYHTDLAGSPVAGSDVNGNIVWREAYTPYGERRLEQVSSGGNRRWFTGQPHEEFTGLTYMGARHYDPMIGRFMGMDPEGPTPRNQFGFNRYAYANNNPYRYTDPTGASCKAVTNDKGQKSANSCTVDHGRDALVKKYGEVGVAKIETAYKDAVNILLDRGYRPDRIDIDTVGSNGKADGGTASAEVRAGELADNLIKRDVGYNPDTGRIMETSDRDQNKMSIGAGVGRLLDSFDILNPSTWNRDAHADLMQSWTHEAMHSDRVHQQLGPRDAWEKNHDAPFNQTAYRLLHPER